MNFSPGRTYLACTFSSDNTLEQARRAIRNNWPATYKKYFDMPQGYGLRKGSGWRVSGGTALLSRCTRFGAEKQRLFLAGLCVLDTFSRFGELPFQLLGFEECFALHRLGISNLFDLPQGFFVGVTL
jgi:hypothetical protein